MGRGSGISGASLNALRSFEAAARHLSFADAAAELGVTPSAISNQVKRLERRLGRPLFLRGHQHVGLSDAGRRLSSRLTAIFLDLERTLSEEIGPLAETLEISVMPSFAAKWLAPRLPDFAKAHPAFPVRVSGSDKLMDFDRGDVDVGLRYGPGGYAPLYEVRISDAAAFPVCSPAYLANNREALTRPSGLLELQLLRDETSLRSARLPSWSAWLQQAGEEGGAAIKGPTFESLHLALAAALAGQGVALGLTPLVDDDLRSGALVAPFDLKLESPDAFWFVCRQDRLREPRIRAFRDWIVRIATTANGSILRQTESIGRTYERYSTD